MTTKKKTTKKKTTRRQPSPSAVRVLVQFAADAHRKLYPVYRPGVFQRADELAESIHEVWDDVMDTPCPIRSVR